MLVLNATPGAVRLVCETCGAHVTPDLVELACMRHTCGVCGDSALTPRLHELRGRFRRGRAPWRRFAPR